MLPVFCLHCLHNYEYGQKILLLVFYYMYLCFDFLSIAFGFFLYGGQDVKNLMYFHLGKLSIIWCIGTGRTISGFCWFCWYSILNYNLFSGLMYHLYLFVCEEIEVLCLSDSILIISDFVLFSFLRQVISSWNTLFSPVNGHSKRRTPLISGKFFFTGRILVKV